MNNSKDRLMNLRPLSEPGPLLTYISNMRAAGLEKEARAMVISIRSALSGPDGKVLMQLLENATFLSPTAILADPRALAARNAQSFIPHDLARILGEELNELVEGKTTRIRR